MQPHSYSKKAKGGKIFGGTILLLVGTFFLLKQLGYTFFLPSWLISWPMFLIVMGLFNGFRHNFRNPAWFIMISIGGVFLAERFMPGLEVSRFLWPVLIILLGIWMIFGPKRNRRNAWCGDDDQQPANPITTSAAYTSNNESVVPTSDVNTGNSWNTTAAAPTKNDYIDSVAVFGGVKKNIVSKNFQGGEVVCFMGGTEINLLQADVQGRVDLEVTQVMGGVRLMIPPHWDVIFEVTAILGGVEDKRNIQPGLINGSKVLVIKGTCVLGGIDVRSF
ncbi:LiaF transmembrane domain-containing protein [Adhaeribacter aquaticus]|uniref:LiaF transmembrane domain-containing protein n=1 Tax=Adhaeribacter aquaticus TaxID=299567 RepID=UPI000429949A|nr:DUF5668 domain-containing protein [Adhaeribacter aquaticus]